MSTSSHLTFVRNLGSYDKMERVTDKYYGQAHSTGNTPDVVYYYDDALGDASTTYSWGKLRQVNVVGYGSGIQGSSKSNGHGYTYDFKGRPVEDVITTTSTYTSRSYITSYTYDVGDRLTSMTYPNPGISEVVTTTYNSQGMGLPASMTSNVGSNPNPVYDTTYNEWGELTSLRQGSAVQSNLLTTQFAYNVRGWLTNTLATTTNGTQTLTHLNMVYGYDANGNVTTLSNTGVFNPNSTTNPTFSNAYTYDWLDRLASGSSTSVGIGGASLFPTETYQYDNLDRMTTRSIGSTPWSYSYADPAHKDAPTSYHNNSYSYDANGDQLTGVVGGNSQTRTYDQERRLVQVTSGTTTLTFIYDGVDKRIVQNVTTGATTTHTLYIGNFYEETLTGASSPPYIVYYMFGGKTVGMRRANYPVLPTNTNGQFRVVGDQLGSTTLLIDTAPVPNVTQREYYKPFGEVAFTSGSSRTDKGFTGQRLDASSGLMYYGARYYDPALSYFISADTIVPSSAGGSEENSKLTVDFHESGFLSSATGENLQIVEKGFWFQLSRRDKQKARDPSGPENPQALNRYGYAQNNPVLNTDATGHIPGVLVITRSVARQLRSVMRNLESSALIAALTALNENRVDEAKRDINQLIDVVNGALTDLVEGPTLSVLTVLLTLLKSAEDDTSTARYIINILQLVQWFGNRINDLAESDDPNAYGSFWLDSGPCWCVHAAFYGNDMPAGWQSTTRFFITEWLMDKLLNGDSAGGLPAFPHSNFGDPLQFQPIHHGGGNNPLPS